MNFWQKLIRLLWLTLFYTVAVSCVLLAAVFGTLRLLLPMMGDYSAEVEKKATEYLGQPVKVRQLDAQWHGWGPSLILKDVQLLDKAGKKTLAKFEKGRVGIAVLQTARTGKLHFSYIDILGVEASLSRDRKGQFHLPGFEIQDTEQQGETGDEGFSQWLLSQGRLNIEIKRLLFSDRMLKRKARVFSDASVSIINEGGRHFLRGQLGTTQATGRRLYFAMDIKGNFMTGSQWQGLLYLKANNLDHREIFGKQFLVENGLTVGSADFEVWAEVDTSRLTAMTGEISLRDARWQLTSYKPLRYKKLATRFNWSLNQDRSQFQLALDNLIVQQGSRSSAANDLRLAAYFGPDSIAELELAANALTPGDLAPVLIRAASLFNVNINEYASLDPKGRLKDIYVHWLAGDGGGNYYAQLSLDKFAISPFKKLPGFDNVSAKLMLDNAGGHARIQTRNARLEFPRLFRQPLPVSSLDANLYWSMQDNTLLVRSYDVHLQTPHVHSRGFVELELDEQASPLLSLAFDFEQGDASGVSAYLPAGIMSKGALSWLDKAFDQGTISKGKALLYGRAADFPYTRGDGVFRVDFDVADVQLDYAPGWPKFNKLEADVHFKGNGFKANIAKGAVYDSVLTDVQVAIAEFSSTMQLSVNGKIEGRTADKLRYLNESGLRESVGRHLAAFEFAGDSRLDLDLKLNFGKRISADFDGKLQFDYNQVRMEKFDPLAEELQGTLFFNNEEIRADALSAVLMEQKVPLNIRTAVKENTGARTVKLTTGVKVDIGAQVKEHFPQWSELVKGQSRVRLELDIPYGGVSGEDTRLPRLNFVSRLVGVDLNLPVPMNKPAHVPRQAIFGVEFPGNNKFWLHGAYGNVWRTLVEIEPEAPRVFQRGELLFGKGRVVLPKGKGLRVNGSLEQISADIWSSLITSSSAVNAANGAGSQEPLSIYDILYSTNLHITKLEYLNQTINNVQLSTSNQGQLIVIDIKSRQIAGIIRLPREADSFRVEMELDRLHLQATDEEGGGGGLDLDPRGLPQMRLSSKSVIFGNRNLGQVALETAKSPDGLIIQQLIIKPRATTMKAHGSWLFNNGQPRSEMSVVMESSNLGKTMKDLGYADTISDGEGVLNASLHWPGSILNPDLKHLSGKVNLNFKDGIIVDFEPGGAARIFGLLSIQTLPRRLLLDFRDIFAKGLVFDSIKGSFEIDEGDAYTKAEQHFSLKGATADAEIRGRIGLSAQDYDQVVLVTPHVSGLTGLVSILVNQPVLFLLQQLIKDDINQSVRFKYSLKGSWINPTLEPIHERPIIVGDDEDEDF